MKKLFSILSVLTLALVFSASAQSDCDIPPTTDPLVKVSDSTAVLTTIYAVQVIATNKPIVHIPAGLVRKYDARVKLHRYYTLDYYFTRAIADAALAAWKAKGYFPVIKAYDYGAVKN